ncbi:MAG TPA: PAS domain S-box protein [Opitutaceae bacterium]|jgi:PAS domain S-box-containing protein|nr:PAS domain S-box protein [Opitutaceae bacterium]
MPESTVLPAPPDAFLAAIVNSSSDAILSKDLQGYITSWNAGAQRLFGYSADEAIGRHVTLLFPPGRYDEEPPILAHIQRGERVEHYETVRRRKDGTLMDISLTVSPIFDDRGRIVGASQIARDISKQRKDRERFRVTLAAVADAVIAADENGRIGFLNAAAVALTGWTEGEAIDAPGECIFRTLDEKTRASRDADLRDVIRGGAAIPLTAHTLLIDRGGQERPIEFSASPVRGAGGAHSGVVIVFRDVSGQRAAELSTLRLAAIIDGSDDAIVGKNLQGIITNWNAGAERLFGYTAEEMIGQSIIRLLPADRRHEEQQILARLQRGERVEHFETIRVRKDGSTVDVSLTISPIRNRDGLIIGASKIARDITALRAAQEKLKAHALELEVKVRERSRKLEESVAELEAFSYSLSHDMRAPLRAIQSFTEIVLTDYGAQIPEGAELLRKVVGAAARMDRLIQDVLAFARLTRAEIHLGPVDLGRLIEDIIHERPELQPPAARIVLQGPLLGVLGHEASLTQCLTNLLHNAVKFVAPDTVPVVEVYTEKAGERVRINIRDNGIGIDAEGRKRLFAIFQRLPTEQSYQGTGIGLAIVRKAAERMGGLVGVDSTPGQGSTFWVELPAAA